MSHEISTVSTTVASEEQAKQLAQTLIESRLAACVQIDGPLSSIYRWQDQIQQDTEFRLVCKTMPSMVASLVADLQKRHPYEVPEILIARYQCSAEYAHWLADQVSCSNE